jgi:hypothetical protein
MLLGLLAPLLSLSLSLSQSLLLLFLVLHSPLTFSPVSHPNPFLCTSLTTRYFNRRTPIHSLPTELLTHIFAQLPPASLGLASLVCKEWYAVVGDEASWRVSVSVAGVCHPLSGKIARLMGVWIQ